jgi:hypothetical protein
LIAKRPRAHAIATTAAGADGKQLPSRRVSGVLIIIIVFVLGPGYV